MGFKGLASEVKGSSLPAENLWKSSNQIQKMWFWVGSGSAVKVKGQRFLGSGLKNEGLVKGAGFNHEGLGVRILKLRIWIYKVRIGL